jgi:predicted N-formylglutamate amidohydrolase
LTAVVILNNNFQMQNQAKMDSPESPKILTPQEGPPVEIINADADTGLLIICEHASNRIPVFFESLGLTQDQVSAHIAWDPGARDVACLLSSAMNAPLVACRVSRLVYDCNRPPNAPAAMPARSEIFDIPGNLNVSAPERRARTEQVYVPFRDTIAGLITEQTASGHAPVLITVHSFTPVFMGKPREVEIGILHGRDRRLADAMLNEAKSVTALKVERNQPYGLEDGVAHTLDVHGYANGLLNVMIEIRNDLIATQQDAAKIASVIRTLIERALSGLGSNSEIERQT